MKNPSIDDEDKFNYITIERFNIRLGVNEPVKVRISDL